MTLQTMIPVYTVSDDTTNNNSRLHTRISLTVSPSSVKSVSFLPGTGPLLVE